MQISKMRLLTSAALTATYLIAAGAAWAQPAAGAAAPPPPPADATTPPPEAGVTTNDRDIIVTATRRAERLENVPATVLAVSGPILQQSGVLNIHDLALVAPGVQISNFGIYSQPSIRGVSTSFAQLAQETNVSLYVDGFYNADQLSTNMDLAGIQDIQVLKGPQGTLYGRNATGGAILITTRSPTDKFQADGYIQYKPRFNDKSANIFVGGPIFNGVKLSLNGYYRQMDGYVKDINHYSKNIVFENKTWLFKDINGVTHADPFNWSNVLNKRRKGNHTDHYKNWYFRPKLVLEPTDNLKVTLGYNLMYINEPRTFNFTWNNSILNKAPAYNGYPVTQAQDKTSLNWRPDGITKTREFTALAEWRLGDLGTLTARYAHRHQKDIQVYDIDGTPAAANVARVGVGNVPAGTGNDTYGINLRTTDVAQLDYSGKFGGLELLSGFFWYKDHAQYKWGYSDTGSSHGPQASYQLYDTKAWAAYIDGTYNFNDKLFVTAGVRYAHDARRATASRWYGDGFLLNTDFPQCYVNGGLIPGVSTSAVTTLSPLCTSSAIITAKKNVLTPRFVLRYNLSQGTNIWASATRGFKATALNLGSPFNTLKPETVWAYEAGIKTARGGLRAEASFFYYDYRNNQLNGFNSNLPQIATIALNAGGAKIYGIDSSVNYRFPGDHFNVRANFEWLNAHYTNIPEGSNTTVDTKGTANLADDTVTTVFANWSGRRMIRAPEFSGTFGIDYNTELFGGNLVASANASFSSRYAPTNASYQCDFHTATAIPGPHQGPNEVTGQKYCDKETNHKKRGLFEENGYVVLNASLSWSDPSDHFKATVFFDNITNNRYFFLARGTAFGNSYRITAPRSVGIRLSAKY